MSKFEIDTNNFKNVFLTRMMISISSEAFEKTTENQRMKDNTVNKNILSVKTDKMVIEQMFSDHKKLRNEENIS